MCIVKLHIYVVWYAYESITFCEIMIMSGRES